MVKISKTHHRTVCGVVKRNPRTRFNIKNWRKTKGQSLSWENTETFSGVSVERLGDSYYVEERWITRMLEVERRRILAEELTKKEAIQFAYRYMREHEDFR